jgi:hypothetical protein
VRKIRHFFLVFASTLTLGTGVIAQETSPAARIKSSLCTRENALTIVQQQIDFTKTFDDDVPRVTVLIRAADLIWPFEEKKARAAYADAFELATRNFREKGAVSRREGKLLVGTEDQRYTVITGIARRDPGWAKRLTDQLLKEQQQEARDKVAKEGQVDVTTPERLLTMASAMLASSNQNIGLSFARESLHYPATLYLSQFLYELAARDKFAADQLYLEALAAQSNAPMERLLYLSSYPFGNDREAGDMPAWTIYQVPDGFTPNPTLQRLFVQTILRRAQDFIDNPTTASFGVRVSDPEEMWLALTRLQGPIHKSLPDLAPASETARANLAAKLSPDSQRELRRKVDDDNPGKSAGTFDEQVEAALKNPNVDRRDEQLASVILYGSKDETLDHVFAALDKISDSSLRQPLVSWLYFDRAQGAVKDRKLGEARKLAAHVDELDQRAFLYSLIVEESLKEKADATQAHEVLEEVLEATAKAPNTMVKVRALLGVAYLYTKFDMDRAVEVVAQAVQSINRIEKPDFTQQFLTRRIEGKTFATYALYPTAGFTPENAFREIGRVDFDSMLNQASNFSDKLLRATMTLALVEQCLTVPAVKPTSPNKAATINPYSSTTNSTSFRTGEEGIDAALHLQPDAFRCRRSRINLPRAR